MSPSNFGNIVYVRNVCARPCLHTWDGTQGLKHTVTTHSTTELHSSLTLKLLCFLDRKLRKGSFPTNKMLCKVAQLHPDCRGRRFKTP